MSSNQELMAYGKIKGELAKFKVFTGSHLEAIKSVRHECDFDGAVMVVIK